jgi:DNA-binding transcriptional LysR family regulator
MKHFDDMYFFAMVVDHGGFSAAARALGMQASKLSRRVAELEGRLGVRLLHRNTRKIAMTDIGQTFYRHCAALVAEAQAATESVDLMRSMPQGLVRVSCPWGLLHGGVTQVVSRFMLDNPLVRVHVEATNRRIDVIEEGFDLALRVRVPPLQDSDLAVRPFASAELWLMGSPRLFDRQLRPSRPEALGALPTLGMVSAGDRHSWAFWGPDGAGIQVAHTPRLVTDDFATLRQAALDGVGLACLPRFIVQADFDTGILERVLPEFALPKGIAHAVFPTRRGMVPAVRHFLDALVAGFESGRDGRLPAANQNPLTQP